MVIVWKLDDVLFAFANKPSRQDDEVGAYGFQLSREKLRRQAQPLEPVHDVRREENHLKKRDVRRPIVRRDFRERVVVDKFADVFLDVRPRTVDKDTPATA